MIVIIGLIIGILIGFFVPFDFPPAFSIYVSVGILACIDSLIGAIRAGVEEKFDIAIFVSGFILNSALAIAFTYLGEKLGIPMYYISVFVFGTRIFNNVGIMRRNIIQKISEKYHKK